MQDDRRNQRHAAITEAAYALLQEKGYAGTSMLAIARAARASNETLYRWYGDKRGLFETMARDNAAEIRAVLERATAPEANAPDALRAFAPAFLRMILGERSVALNRAAAADASGELGAAVSAGGRESIMPLLDALVARLGVPEAQAGALGTLYLGLLLGDLQIRRVIGVAPTPSEEDIAERCELAHRAFAAILRGPPKVDAH